jgi:hypothetical protein
MAMPPAPATFMGQIFFPDGTTVPDGLSVKVLFDGTVYSSDQTFTSGGESGKYVLSVPGDDPSTPSIEGPGAGDTITFEVDGVATQETATWNTMEVVSLDLNVEPLDVTAINPEQGLSSGGTSVTITGANFMSATTVEIGGVACTDIAIVNSQELTCTTGAHAAGTVDVAVTAGNGSGSLPGGFLYTDNTPIIQAINPAAGSASGGTNVTITGSNFVAGTTVTIGNAACTDVAIISDGELTCTTTSHTTGTADVTVTTEHGSDTLVDGYTYSDEQLPVVTSITPAQGPFSGGTVVSVIGSNFMPGTIVYVGQAPCANITIVDDTELTCTTNNHDAGSVDVTITTDNGTTTLADGYTYSQDASMVLEPAQVTIVKGQVFTLEITVDLGSAQADTLDAYIDFDPDYLEVIDASGTLASSIERNTEVFSSENYNQVDNTAGHINFSASRYIPPYIADSFVAATIRFRAKADGTETPVSFVRNGVRSSNLYFGGSSGNPTTADSNVDILSHLTLKGKVSLPSLLGLPGDTKWVTKLFRDCGNTPLNQITFYEQDTDTVKGTVSATTNEHGQFEVQLTGIMVDTYDIEVKGCTTLSNRKDGISLPGTDEVDFGQLLLGDTSGDNKINGADVSYIVPAFLTTEGDADFQPCANVNKDMYINGADISALIPNYLEAGPNTITTLVSRLTRNLFNYPNNTQGASLAFSRSLEQAQVGDIVAVDILADTGAANADTVDAYITFDPETVQVVDAEGNPAQVIAVNTSLFDGVAYNMVDNAAGHIDLSVFRFSTPPLSEQFTVATIYFKIQAQTDETSMLFKQDGPRQSDVLRGGESLRPYIADLEASQRVYIPIVQQ